MTAPAEQPRKGLIFVAACPVCHAEVWTYRRIGGTTMLGPHREKRRRGRLAPFCPGGGQPLAEAAV